MRGRVFDGVRRFIADEAAQAMTEYLVLTMFTVLACLYLLNPNTELYQGLRRFYELIMRGVFFPGP
ncbi:MAG: hypothetical protein K8T26_09180 [Lentisphaerae bacterium]|nr:hypothetical protein [Lentisphaerota bacterium]